jgi:hypothetical protein
MVTKIAIAMGSEKGIMDLDFRAARNARDEFGSRTSCHGLLPIGRSSSKTRSILAASE